jgi:NADH-quinone oxidoreductase subunit F
MDCKQFEGADYAGIRWSFNRNKVISAEMSKMEFFEIDLGLSVYEFMNSDDEYIGGIQTDRPLEAWYWFSGRKFGSSFTSSF